MRRGAAFRGSGVASWRSRVMDGLPTAGLPPMMRNWSEYVWLVNHLVETGYIDTIRELWWDIRPHHTFGTIELRIYDVPGNLEDAIALAALSQCLVRYLSVQIDESAYQHDCHPFMIRENKWQAARFGLDCSEYLDHVLVMADRPNWSQRQVELYEELGDPVEMVRRMTEASRL